MQPFSRTFMVFTISVACAPGQASASLYILSHIGIFLPISRHLCASRVTGFCDHPPFVIVEFRAATFCAGRPETPVIAQVRDDQSPRDWLQIPPNLPSANFCDFLAFYPKLTGFSQRWCRGHGFYDHTPTVVVIVCATLTCL